MCLFSLESVILIVVTRNCLLFSRAEKLVGPRCVQIVSKRKQNPLLKLARICTICKVHSNLQGVSVSASESIDWSYGHVLQWQKNALADLQRCLFMVEPTCQRQRIYMNENQTGDIFYRLDQISCSIVKCKCTTAWIYGGFQINRTSEIGNGMVSTENNCLLTIIRSRFFGDIPHDKCWK